MVTLRRTKGAPLTHDEMDNNFAEIAAKMNSANPATSGNLTHNGNAFFEGGRPIVINRDLGVVQIKADTGAWAIQYSFVAPNNSDFGGFGAYGNANALSYYYIGPSYNAPVLRAFPSGNVSIGAATDAYRLYVANNAATSTVPASNVIARLQSNGAGADATLQFSDGVANAASISMTGGTLRLAPLGDTLHTSATGCLGYGQGAGGTVGQPTSKSTAVTINRPSGIITTHNAALAAGGKVAFAVNNSLIVAGITLPSVAAINNSVGDSIRYRASVTLVGSGVFYVTLENIGAATYSDYVDISFSLSRVATS